MSSLELHDPTKPRVYCPTCGEVRGSLHYSRPRGRAQSFAFPHHRNTADAQNVLCLGGPVDVEADRAT